MIDCLLLAGSPNTGPLQDVSTARYEATIPVGGRPMFGFVLDALRGSAQIGQIIVVGPPDLNKYINHPDTRLVPMKQGLMDNIAEGFTALGMPDAPVLVATSDIPLLTATALDDFLAHCGAMDADIYYPVVSEETVSKAFPGVKRTYVRLKDGRFTGGNISVFRPSVFGQCRAKGEEFSMYRKKPLKLAMVVGSGFLVRFVVGALSLADAEKKITGLVGVRGRVIVSDYPEIAVDVDKPSDYHLVEALLNAI
ncbi:MAG: hypothetical protein C4575_02210 [Desulforudis sp.]|jgi:GTP:adenosylcobinamide-phosphate guanylyltransferase|nr:nucleotidyltransferase family protein [Clostridia bacterium]MDQ7791855.1 nucleotidyltransferase family protein [Clostridia bacterium]RJX22092.1 MAG: hypothetical protein C4575_02210 [Desulforudis sp.]